MGKSLGYWKSKLFRKKISCALQDIALNTDDITLKFHEAEPPFVKERKKALSFGASQNIFDKFSRTNYVANGVFELTDARLVSNSGWVYTKDQKLILEATWYAGYPEELSGTKQRIARFPQILDANVLSLVSDFALVNYGHKLYDAFARFYLVKKSGIDLKQIDYIMLPGNRSNRWLKVAEKIGIPVEKVIWANEYDNLRIKKLFFTSYPGLRRNYPPWLTKFLKDHLSESVINPGRKLYVQRTGRRKISNEAEILPILKKYGFEIYLPENSADSFKDFAEAKSIIGAHGTGLNDIAFCNPGVRILELIPSDHVYEYFYSIADSAELEYGYIVGESEEVRPEGSTGPSLSDFYVDPELFEATIIQFFKE